jgi:hypothetical protein
VKCDSLSGCGWDAKAVAGARARKVLGFNSPKCFGASLEPFVFMLEDSGTEIRLAHIAFFHRKGGKKEEEKNREAQ